MIKLFLELIPSDTIFFSGMLSLIEPQQNPSVNQYNFVLNGRNDQMMTIDVFYLFDSICKLTQTNLKVNKIAVFLARFPFFSQKMYCEDGTILYRIHGVSSPQTFLNKDFVPLVLRNGLSVKKKSNWIRNKSNRK